MGAILGCDKRFVNRVFVESPSHQGSETYQMEGICNLMNPLFMLDFVLLKQNASKNDQQHKRCKWKNSISSELYLISRPMR